jgi:hypothetical protein
MKEQVRFYGIDSFGRPVFRSLQHPRNFFGSVDRLCRTPEEANKIEAMDLCFFGNSFDCEPMGTAADNLEVIK